MLNQQLDILVIEDNPGDYLLVHEYLGERFKDATISHADSIKAAIELLSHNQFHIMLLDLTLPDGMGLESYQVMHQTAPGTPIIILTGIGDTDMALEALKFGAQDYIIKDDCNATVLAKSIQYGIERSKIVDHLVKSEEQYKYLFDSNPLPMWAYEKSTRKFLMVNDAAIQQFGYTLEDFLQMHTDDMKASNVGTQAHDINASFLTDLKYQTKSGVVMDVEINTHDIIVDGKQACLAVVHDVTERNKAREQLRQSEQKFRTISENFPNGAVAILDKDLTILYMAGKEFHVHDVNADYFEETIYTSHFDTPEKEKVIEKLQRVFKGNNIVFEASHQCNSYMISAVPLMERDGSINKIVLASQNITEQKRNEHEKELLIEELTQNNSDLRQFSYITSHNLRAPLSNLLGIIKLLDLSLVTDDTNSLLLKNFEECTLQLNDTVNDLINVLIIKNNVNAKKETLDMQEIFKRVFNSIQTTIDRSDVQLEVDFSEANEVQFNRTYLESILLNLLTNAVKYSSPKRQPVIKIYTKNAPEGVKLFFSDNGLGIDLKRYKDRIFGLYQRFHDHADSKGLGLYIVNSQIRVMGGEIDIESEVDKGTTFIITFKN